MVLAEKELWEIVEGSQKSPFSSRDPKVRIVYNWQEKKTFTILAFNLSHLQLSHIQLCKTLTEAWAKVCKIHKAKSLVNILFVTRKLFTINMEEDDDMLAHINKVKALADQLNVRT